MNWPTITDGGVLVNAHLLLSLAALGAEASNWGTFLTPILDPHLRTVRGEGLRFLHLQVIGQVMEDARAVLHRLEERIAEFTADLIITIFTVH